MISYLLKNSEFSGLLKFVSPNLAKVASPMALISIANRLRKNHADAGAWAALAPQALAAGGDAEQRTGEWTPRERGERVLRLFFDQILLRRAWVLDLRSDAFRFPPGEAMSWSPQALYLEMDPEFLGAIRELYFGFYRSDDARFDSALRQLGLTGARDALRAHFGEGDQGSVEFRLKDFQRTFTEVFEACARARARLHPDFFPLGLMILTLYENLEGLATPFDVRSCFERSAHRAGLSRVGMK